MSNQDNSIPFGSAEVSYDPIIRSITSDLALLGNALMTRINDPLTILEFISFDSIPAQQLKNQLHSLNRALNQCDNDDDRLKILIEMHYLLAKEGIQASDDHQVFQQLKNRLEQAKELKGNALKKEVSKFQVEVLQAVPGITPEEYQELMTDLNRLEEVEDLNENIDKVYEKINMHMQLPFND